MPESESNWRPGMPWLTSVASWKGPGEELPLLPGPLHFWYIRKTGFQSIPKSEKKAMRRPPGRPPGRTQDRPFMMRVTEEWLTQIDDWSKRQEDKPSRSEAIRR